MQKYARVSGTRFPRSSWDDDWPRPSERSRGERGGKEGKTGKTGARKRDENIAEEWRGLKGGRRRGSRVKLLAAGIRYPRLINRASATLFYHSTVSIAFSFYRTYIEKPSANRRARVELFISRNGRNVFAATAKNFCGWRGRSCGTGYYSRAWGTN